VRLFDPDRKNQATNWQLAIFDINVLRKTDK